MPYLAMASAIVKQLQLPAFYIVCPKQDDDFYEIMKFVVF